MSDYMVFYVCPSVGCKWEVVPSFGDPFFISEVCCPECGENIDKARLTRLKNTKTKRFVSTSIWFKPWSWSGGYYEERRGK